MTTSDPLAGAQAARDRVAAQVASAEARRDAVHGLAQELRSAAAVVTSPRREVSVTAQPGGRIVSVEFARAAEELSAAELSRLVTTTIARAQHRAASEAVERSGQILGPDSPFVAQLREDVGAAFPDPSPGGGAWTG